MSNKNRFAGALQVKRRKFQDWVQIFHKRQTEWNKLGIRQLKQANLLVGINKRGKKSKYI